MAGCPTPAPESQLAPLLNDASAWQSAPSISLVQPLPLATNRSRLRSASALQDVALWIGLHAYEECHTRDPPRLHVPTIRSDVSLDMETFEAHFRRVGRPVRIPFSSLAALGFNTLHGQSADALLRRGLPRADNTSGGTVAALRRGLALINGAARSGQPLTNDQISAIPRRRVLPPSDALHSILRLRPPPLVAAKAYAEPRLWVGGNVTRHTPFHHDGR